MRKRTNPADELQDQRHGNRKVEEQRGEDRYEIFAQHEKYAAPRLVDHRHEQGEDPDRCQRHDPASEHDHDIVERLKDLPQGLHFVLR